MHNCLTRPTSWGHFKGTHARIFSNKFGKSLTYSYLCTQYGTELHLDCVFHHRLCDCKTAFEISLGLTGVLSLWLGIMKIGEKGGIVNVLAKVLSPVFVKLFPDIPKGHPVTGSIFMNIAANMLGLDNAATPLGLKAMEQLQELNPKKDTATNPMIMFLVLNTSGLTLIPISIMVYRAQMGAAQPTDIFIPILLATFFSTLAGIIITSLYQKINLGNDHLGLRTDGLAADE